MVVAGYGDSQPGAMLENNVVNDCVQVYKWLQNRTESPIFIWGHSLGAGLAASTVARLDQNANLSGLVLEAAFTSLTDELYFHPYVKVMYLLTLAWGPQSMLFSTLSGCLGFGTLSSNHCSRMDFSLIPLNTLKRCIVPYCFCTLRMMKLCRIL